MKAFRRTYEPGQFSQVNLPDGTKLLISVGSTDMRVAKLGFLNIPVGTVWKYDFGFPPIRTNPSTATEASKKVMDAILRIVEGCQSLPEAQHRLHDEGTRFLERVEGKRDDQEFLDFPIR